MYLEALNKCYPVLWFCPKWDLTSSSCIQTGLGGSLISRARTMQGDSKVPTRFEQGVGRFSRWIELHAFPIVSVTNDHIVMV